MRSNSLLVYLKVYKTNNILRNPKNKRNAIQLFKFQFQIVMSKIVVLSIYLLAVRECVFLLPCIQPKSSLFQNSNQFEFLLNYFTMLVTCQTPCRPVCIYYLHGLYCCCFVVVLLLVVLLTTKRYRISLNSVVLSDLFLMVFVKEAWTTPKICGPICLQFILCKCYALLSTTKSNVT